MIHLHTFTVIYQSLANISTCSLPWSQTWQWKIHQLRSFCHSNSPFSEDSQLPCLIGGGKVGHFPTPQIRRTGNPWLLFDLQAVPIRKAQHFWPGRYVLGGDVWGVWGPFHGKTNTPKSYFLPQSEIGLRSKDGSFLKRRFLTVLDNPIHHIHPHTKFLH